MRGDPRLEKVIAAILARGLEFTAPDVYLAFDRLNDLRCRARLELDKARLATCPPCASPPPAGCSVFPYLCMHAFPKPPGYCSIFVLRTRYPNPTIHCSIILFLRIPWKPTHQSLLDVFLMDGQPTRSRSKTCFSIPLLCLRVIASGVLISFQLLVPLKWTGSATLKCFTFSMC